MRPLRIVFALLLLGGTAAEGLKRVLLVTHAGGYMHDSVLIAERFRQASSYGRFHPKRSMNLQVITSARKLLTNRSYGVSYHLCSG